MQTFDRINLLGAGVVILGLLFFGLKDKDIEPHTRVTDFPIAYTLEKETVPYDLQTFTQKLPLRP